MILKEVSNNIYYLPHDETTDRPTLGYIRGENYSVMIDSGNSKRHVELFFDGLKKRGLEPPKFVIISHWHWDHTFGIVSLNSKVIANKLTNRQLKKIESWKWTDKDMKERLESGEEIEFCDKYIRLEYKDLNEIKVKTADIIFDKSLTLDLGNLHCEILLVGGPHSKDSTIVWIPEEKVLFSGDADCEGCYSGEESYNKYELARYLNIIRETEFETYIHGHCEPMSKTKLINELEEELKSL